MQSILKLLMTGKEKPQGGIMIPIPQYPLYTATIAEYNAYAVSALILFEESFFFAVMLLFFLDFIHGACD